EERARRREAAQLAAGRPRPGSPRGSSGRPCHGCGSPRRGRDACACDCALPPAPAGGGGEKIGGGREEEEEEGEEGGGPPASGGPAALVEEAGVLPAASVTYSCSPPNMGVRMARASAAAHG
ncbi:unnamed protein product, partial [Prorocentrum cordatum]